MYVRFPGQAFECSSNDAPILIEHNDRLFPMAVPHLLAINRPSSCGSLGAGHHTRQQAREQQENETTIKSGKDIGSDLRGFLHHLSHPLTFRNKVCYLRTNPSRPGS
jgi:hypothetical protein